jgi:integrase
MDITVRRGKEKLRVRKTARVKSKTEALVEEAKERARLDAAPMVKGRSPFFSDFADTFLTTYSKAENKASEQASKKMILDKHLKPFFGHLRLDEIGDELVTSYKNTKLDTLSKKSINNHLMVFNRLYTIAKKWGKVSHAVRAELFRVAQGDFDFFPPDESARLVDGAEPGQWRTMILLALRAGLRISELRALEWGDVDLEAGRVLVKRQEWEGHVDTPKGGKSAEVPLSNEIRQALATLPSRFARKYVFPGPKGKMLTRGECNSPLWRACRKAGLREVGWHVLRHSFASQLAMAGVSLKAIQELMRLSSIAMVLRYAHLTPTVRRDAVALLDGAPKKGGKKDEAVS